MNFPKRRDQEEIKLRKKATYYRLLSIGIIIGLLTCLLPTFLSAMPLESINGPDHITLTWSDNPQTTQTITWRSPAGIVNGQVEYAEFVPSPNAVPQVITVSAENSLLSTNLSDVNLHFVTLHNLKSATRYRYRVGEGSTWSNEHTFFTAPAAATKFKFLVFGDSQSINYNTWHTTLQQAYQANRDAAFFTNVGDLVDVGQDETHWNGWFDAARGVIDTIPAMPVTGNHEMYTLEGHFSLPSLFTEQLKLPANGPEQLRGQAYSFNYGDVHFVVLDSQAGEEARFIPELLQIQRDWLEKDLAATDRKWKIVFMHRPPYNNKDDGSNPSVRRAFVPIFDKYHADLVFTGHDHAYARTYPLYGDAPMDSAAKGTIYVATGRSGTKTYSNTAGKEWNAFFYNPLDEPNYLTVEVADNSLTVKAFKSSGVLIDTWSIAKNSQVDFN